MKTVLCDINILLDIFLKRKPFYYSSSTLFKKIEEKTIKGYLCSLSFPILFYILSKELNSQKAINILKKLRIVFEVALVDEKVIDLALASEFKDMEDAIQYYSAINMKLDFFITRNKKDYQIKQIPILTPQEFLGII